MAKHRRRHRGFTLAEMIIVVLVVALAAAVAIPSLNNLTHANLRKSASTLSGTIRFLYNQAQMKGLCMRLVLDLDNNTYYAEAADGPTCLLNKELAEVNDGAVQWEKKLNKEKEQSSTSIGGWGGERPVSLKVKRAAFQKIGGPLLKPRKLPAGVSFDAVFVTHQKDKAEKGKTYIHCLPMGFCERALIWLKDSSDHYFTLRVHPLTGKVEIKPKELELTREDKDRKKGDDKDLN